MKEYENDINKFLNSIGFGFPENTEELNNFDSFYKNHAFKSDVNKIDPEKIWASVNEKVTTLSQVDYHRRTVLAAEIIYQLKDDLTLGHLKLQKLLFLCQNAMNMRIETNFLKQALGPYDPVLMRSLDKQFESRKWYKFQKDDFPKYIPLEKCGEHQEWYEKYFNKNIDQVNFLIETFRNLKTTDVELVVTIFACWKEILDVGLETSNELIIEKVYSWSKEKAKFSKGDIIHAITWMETKGIIPR